MRTLGILSVLSASLIGTVFDGMALADPSVPGFTVQTYANVTDPVKMTFDPLGNLYVGRDAAGSGGTSTQAVKIHRVGPGGAPVVEYGSAPIADPDSVVFDALGVVSGTPGSVLVGGSTLDGGVISAIRPNETVVGRFGPTTTFTNPVDMSFDSTGRPVIPDEGTFRVLTSTGAFPSILFFSPPRPRHLALDAANRIYLSLSDGTIRIHNPDGSVVNPAFVASGLGNEIPIAIGPGGPLWGTDLYAVSSNSGDLFRIDSMGSAELIGTGFTGTAVDLAFGPDGMLYVSMFGEDRILRIVPEPSTVGLLVMGAVLLRRRRSWQ